MIMSLIRMQAVTIYLGCFCSEDTVVSSEFTFFRLLNVYSFVSFGWETRIHACDLDKGVPDWDTYIFNRKIKGIYRKLKMNIFYKS